MPRKTNKAKSKTAQGRPKASRPQLLANDPHVFQRPCPQQSSPIFRLPLEMRISIFELVLAPNSKMPSHINESAKSSRSVPIPIHHHTALLATCKRIYLETYLLLARVRVHKCYLVNGPWASPRRYFEHHLAPEQLAQVREVQIFSHLCKLEKKHPHLAQQLEPVSSTLRHLTITIRESDWHGGWPDGPYCNPFRAGGSLLSEMLEDMKAFGKGKKYRMAPDGWGSSFKALTALESLTMEFEDREENRYRLEDLVPWAHRTWRFPAADGRFLVSSEMPSLTKWRPVCPHDGPFSRCEKCNYRWQLADRQGYISSVPLQQGPLIYRFSVRWESKAPKDIVRFIMDDKLIDAPKAKHLRRYKPRGTKGYVGVRAPNPMDFMDYW
ncbi:hypothetical protein F4778DRAFT_354818 [Xylariomycetidae sp. FL2044]|nr:hypothetical protein F4778DRAFT_354818 [Xylariomycetidae sp. FL2044]